MNGCVPLDVAGETLLLHPERAVLWPARATVIVADTHFGKSGIFRRHGHAVPAGSDDYDRDRLAVLIQAVHARRLIVLGDFLHAPLDGDDPDARDLGRWSQTLRAEIHVIAGNHDRGAAARWLPPVHWHPADVLEPPLRFTHDADRASRDESLYTLSGHIHPVAKLGRPGKPSPRVPIFWQRDAGLVLPSFGVFTGGHVVRPSGNDRVFAVGPQRVVRFR